MSWCVHIRFHKISYILYIAHIHRPVHEPILGIILGVFLSRYTFIDLLQIFGKEKPILEHGDLQLLSVKGSLSTNPGMVIAKFNNLYLYLEPK